MAKQYRIWELVKMWQEGDKGKFETKNVNFRPVVLDDEGIFLDASSFQQKEYFYINRLDKNMLWTKVQEPVDFITAYDSGKKIKPESLSGTKACMDLGIFQIPRAALHDLRKLDYEESAKLINGKWLIQEDEDE